MSHTGTLNIAASLRRACLNPSLDAVILAPARVCLHAQSIFGGGRDFLFTLFTLKGFFFVVACPQLFVIRQKPTYYPDLFLSGAKEKEGSL